MLLVAFFFVIFSFLFAVVSFLISLYLHSVVLDDQLPLSKLVLLHVLAAEMLGHEPFSAESNS